MNLYNKKLKLIIVFTVLLPVIIGSIYFLYYKNKTMDLNVILITACSLRADHLGCYGYKKNTSPCIDSLAKDGVLFNNAVTQATFTWASIHSMITSTYVSTNKVYFFEEFLSDKTLTLPYLLKNKGYATSFFSNQGGLRKLNESLGGIFDTFIIKENKVNADGLTQDAIVWVKENLNKNFFMWLLYSDIHEDSVGLPRNRQDISNEEAEGYILMYDKKITFLDSQINILLQSLKSLDLSKNTIIIFTSDHGEMMGEHLEYSWYFAHGNRPCDPLIMSPLIFYCPILKSRDKIIYKEVQLIDIVPTICDILKVNKPHAFEGRSLLNLIKKGGKHYAYAFTEHRNVPRGFIEPTAALEYMISLRTINWKLILLINEEGKHYQLYDLKKDPLESHNVFNIEKGSFKLLKLELEKFINRPKQNIAPLTKPLDSESKKILKSLGYAQ